MPPRQPDEPPAQVKEKPTQAPSFAPLTEAGIYDGIAEARYHADCCPAPSLSRTVLHRLLEQSPRHAWAIHPRLGGAPEPDAAEDSTEAAAVGTAAHSAFLQNSSILDCLDFPDWRTNAAKAAKAQSYADGRIPLLPKAYSRAMTLIDVLETFRARTGAFTDGRGEQTAIWQEGAIWCRARIDWLPDNPEAAPWDLKTTAGPATLQAWSRAAWSKGTQLQDSLYCRGLEILRGEPPMPMRFAVVEQKPPYGIAVFEMSPVSREMADHDVRLGIETWAHCLAANDWPSYPEECQYLDPPGWVIREHENRAAIGGRNLDLLRGRDHPNAAQYIETGNFGG